MRLVLYLILLLALINAVVLDKAVNILSPKELKRRARGGHDKKGANIYKMAAYGKSLNILLWLKGSVAAALLFVLVLSDSWVGAIVFVGALAWAVRAWHVRSAHSWVWSWAAAVGPSVAWVMNYLQPLLGRIGGKSKATAASKIYDKEDLLEFLKSQNSQSDNRITGSELRMAYNALTFGDKKVTDVMTPLRQVRLVADSEVLGPMLMDDLHKTGFSRFPVVKEGTGRTTNPEIVGTLYLKELLGYDGGGTVRTLMDHKVFYVNETQSLRDALTAFLKTHHHLFVVVNNFEELVGVVSIEDIIEQILGQPIVDEFDRYDDLRAVAGLEAKKESTQHEKVETPKEK